MKRRHGGHEVAMPGHDGVQRGRWRQRNGSWGGSRSCNRLLTAYQMCGPEPNHGPNQQPGRGQNGGPENENAAGGRVRIPGRWNGLWRPAAIWLIRRLTLHLPSIVTECASIASLQFILEDAFCARYPVPPSAPLRHLHRWRQSTLPAPRRILKAGLPRDRTHPCTSNSAAKSSTGCYNEH